MPAKADETIPIEELIGELDPNRPVDPEYAAWEMEQLRAAMKDLEENPDGDLTHEEVFAEIDEIIKKHQRL